MAESSAARGEEWFILQRRALTLSFALLVLCCSAAFLCQPLLLYLLPMEAEGAELFKFRVLAFVFAAVLGVPLFAVSISLFLRLRHRYAISADERGLFVYSGIFPLGLIPWRAVKNLACHSEMGSVGFVKKFQIVLKADEVGKNLQWRIRNGFRRNPLDEPRLSVSFFLCRGREDDNAKKMVRLWSLYR